MYKGTIPRRLEYGERVLSLLFNAIISFQGYCCEIFFSVPLQGDINLATAVLCGHIVSLCVVVLSANWDTNPVLTMTQQFPFFVGLVLCVLSHFAAQQKKWMLSKFPGLLFINLDSSYKILQKSGLLPNLSCTLSRK